MASKPIIAPSILSADLTRLGEQIAEAEAAGADWIHVDVMDGRFVPPISFGQVVVEASRKATKLPLDVHLMVADPDPLLDSFADAGADHLLVHIETCPHIHRTLQHIHKLGCKAGVVLNPGTSVTAVEEVLGLADIVLVMSVNPGYSGQAFIPEVLPKAAELRELIDANDYQTLIEIDGGIDAHTLPDAQAAGVDAFVAASAIYHHPDGVAAGIQALRSASSTLIER